MPDTLRIRPVRVTDSDALALIEEVQGEYVARYGGRDGTPLEVGVFDPPGGAFFVGYVEGRPVAMGGWRSRPDVSRLGGVRAAEVKRMYVAPSGRRRGFARAVLRHLEQTAAAAGADVMVLETGIAQPEAIELYTSAGYVLVEKFGHYAWSPKSRCFGKRL
jgi:ribosomal protein S18 acetylase RimI-like enzyme